MFETNKTKRISESGNDPHSKILEFFSYTYMCAIQTLLGF